MSADMYDFPEFLQRMVQLPLAAILHEAEAECARVDRTLYGVRGAPKRRDEGGVEHVARLKAFMFFLQSGIKPGSASASEFAMYRPVVEALVQRGELQKEALGRFPASAP